MPKTQNVGKKQAEKSFSKFNVQSIKHFVIQENADKIAKQKIHKYPELVHLNRIQHNEWSSLNSRFLRAVVDFNNEVVMEV